MWRRKSRFGCLFRGEGAAAGKADSAPCAHAPASAGYKAAPRARPDKVQASCDVTVLARGCPSERTRQPEEDATGTLSPAELQLCRRVTHTLGAASPA